MRVYCTQVAASTQHSARLVHVRKYQHHSAMLHVINSSDGQRYKALYTDSASLCCRLLTITRSLDTLKT
jgi:hypothetical protein